MAAVNSYSHSGSYFAHKSESTVSVKSWMNTKLSSLSVYTGTFLLFDSLLFFHKEHFSEAEEKGSGIELHCYNKAYFLIFLKF